jgi:site-specific DNA-methyltransferase (adenine-specific)
MEPYWSDETCALYLGDCREVLPALGVTADCIIADPPYESTSLEWDCWPDGWLEAAAGVSNSMWCFLPLRQFAEPPYRGAEFRAAGWRMSHDAVWEKHNGSGFAADRFKCVHETMTHWYRGRWGAIYHEAPRVFAGVDPKSRKGGDRKAATDRHHGTLNGSLWTDDGTRIVRSVIRARSMHGLSPISRTQKPELLLSPLIEYACPPGGLVVDLFAGSCSTLRACRNGGRRAIGIELREKQAEAAAHWLSELTLEAI